jgi:uncharacterized protein (DUF2147 family)
MTTVAYADGPSGVWQSEKDEDGDWIDLAIGPCGAELCGTVAEVYGGNPEVVGLTIIEGMIQVSENEWSDGRIFAVDEDTWYDSKMELISPDQLKISGCIGFGLLCESQTLNRAP